MGNAWELPFTESTFTVEPQVRSWTAEVLSVPPGSLIRHNSDDNDNTHDKDDDADVAAARVTRAAGSRPSSEEMLQRGYMLRKGDTLACKISILTNGDMRKKDDTNAAVEALSSWSRQNHIAYAAERGYCLMHVKCIQPGNVRCPTRLSLFTAYAVLNQLIEQWLVNPAESYVVKLDLDAFFMDFTTRIEDVITAAESAGRGVVSETENVSAAAFENVAPEIGEEWQVPSASRHRFSIAIAADAGECHRSIPYNSGVIIWRGSEVALAILRAFFKRTTEDGGDQIILTHVLESNLIKLFRDPTRRACMAIKNEKVANPTKSSLAVPGRVINWNSDGSCVVFTPRTFNSFRRAVNAYEMNGSRPIYHKALPNPNFWLPNDFIAHFTGISARQRISVIKPTCEKAASVGGRCVCPWLCDEEQDGLSPNAP